MINENNWRVLFTWISILNFSTVYTSANGNWLKLILYPVFVFIIPNIPVKNFSDFRSAKNQNVPKVWINLCNDNFNLQQFSNRDCVFNTAFFIRKFKSISVRKRVFHLGEWGAGGRQYEKFCSFFFLVLNILSKIYISFRKNATISVSISA